MRGIWLLLCVVACDPGLDPVDDDPGSETDTGSETGTETDTGSETGTETDTDPTPTEEDHVRALIAGSEKVAEVHPAIAWGSGWPFETGEGTWIFVRRQVADEVVQVAGDFDGWQGVGMTRGNGFAWAEVRVPDPEGSKYKFIVDGADWRADAGARSYGYDDNGQYSLVRAPTDMARLDRWPGFAAEGLKPRDLRVHVPPGSGPWPVLYAHDGQNLFNPDAIGGGWRLQEVADGILVVGIDNTDQRMSEYVHVDDSIDGDGFAALGTEHADLLHRGVRPHIEATYGSTGVDGVIGSSLGGLQALNTVLRHDDYDFVASMSGTLGWGRFGLTNSTMRELWEAEPLHDVVIYVDSGGGDGGDGCHDPDNDGETEDDPNARDNYCTTRAFADAMAAHGYEWNTTLHHWHQAGAPHNESAWAARVHRPLGIFRDLAK